jgi:hypothetical protein
VYFALWDVRPEPYLDRQQPLLATPMRFRLGRTNADGRPVIVTDDEEGNEIPVMHFLEGETPFPGDITKVAENLVAILNGEPPPHLVDIGPNRIHWRREPTGMSLHIEPIEPEATAD